VSRPIPEFLRKQFERGEVPMDEPPGLTEGYYRQWVMETPEPRDHPERLATDGLCLICGLPEMALPHCRYVAFGGSVSTPEPAALRSELHAACRDRDEWRQAALDGLRTIGRLTELLHRAARPAVLRLPPIAPEEFQRLVEANDGDMIRVEEPNRFTSSPSPPDGSCYGLGHSAVMTPNEDGYEVGEMDEQPAKRNRDHEDEGFDDDALEPF
jgi:hypothetical protein